MLNPFKKSPARAKKEKPQVTKKEDETRTPVRLAKERHIAGFGLVPHLTEKTMAGGVRRWYAFRVPLVVNKIAAKRAVEKRYGVKVMRVRASSFYGKRVRLGRITGRTPGFKKILVKLVPGQSIELT